jgi:hypothetical protein
MDYEEAYERIMKGVRKHDAGFGYWYIPNDKFDFICAYMFMSGLIEAGERCQQIVREAHGASPMGEKITRLEQDIAELEHERDQLREQVADLQFQSASGRARPANSGSKRE